MTTSPLTPAQRAALRRALEYTEPGWVGRLSLFGQSAAFALRLVDAGVAAYRHVLTEAERTALTHHIESGVVEAKVYLERGDWHAAYGCLERAGILERTRDEQALYITDLGRAAVA